LLLHFGFTTKDFSSYDNLMSSSPLKKLITNYDKGSKLTYLAIRERIGTAKDNARKLDIYAKTNYKNTHEPYLFPCYTSFHELLKAIDDF
ncbi:hypothetical protein PCJ50_27975, partial [Klebsiella pneumoniae]